MSDAFTPATEIARRMKREMVSKWKEGDPEEDCDLLTMAMAVRDGKVVAQVVAPSGPRGHRFAVKAAALFFRASEVFVLADSIMKSVKEEDRKQAEDIAPGELHDNWRAGKRAGLSECIMACRMTAEGESEMRSWPYVRTGNKIEFGELVASPGVSFDGAIPDYAADGFAMAKEKWPELMEVMTMAAEATGVADDERYLDRGAAMFASEQLHTTIMLYELGPLFPRMYHNGNRLEVVHARG